MSLSDFESDLTELSSSDEEYIPVSLKPQKKKAPSKPNAEYKVTNALRPPRTTSYTARSLYDQIIDGAIILDPPYQRDVVWSEPKQVGLIDSLLRNYYIPPLIFAVTSRDDGTESRVCIDGKQRLTSIQQFMDGLICHKDTFTNKKYWFKGGTGKRVPLPKQYLQAFANKQIVCVEYDSLSDDQEREIFRRVQMGVALTPAERMQAIAGPWTTLIRDIQLKVLGEDGFGEDLDWGHARGRDFQCLASIVYLIDNYPTSKFPDATQLEKWLSSSGPVSANFQEGIMDTFRIFIALVKDSKYNAAFQKPTRVSPIEFTMTGVLIHLYRLKFSLQQLSSAIWKMRADVRTKHVDVRANTKVASTMYTFITEDIKGIELQGDEKGDSPAVTMIKSASLTCKLSKREREEDTSDNEYEELTGSPHRADIRELVPRRGKAGER
ncbi:hypothetical protein A0H81_07172 [Grifola frondosa]|uniref:GmrSD restriction endonucleases N-terminal domain-containing protein n=1 Tax=Grifola frondosa TaxID=5627 RepID=A0A1C7M9Q9_GRIFR|nr:hypothetical protein A0H81_07172 [Grifola frondosa]